jgi:hypothetical protein
MAVSRIDTEEAKREKPPPGPHRKSDPKSEKEIFLTRN